jgi:hypothetical protein
MDTFCISCPSGSYHQSATLLSHNRLILAEQCFHSIITFYTAYHEQHLRFKPNRSRHLLAISYKAMYCTDWHKAASVWTSSQLVSDQESIIWNKSGYWLWWMHTKTESQQHGNTRKKYSKLLCEQTTLHEQHRKPKFYICAKNRFSVGRTGKDHPAVDSSCVFWFSSIL